MKTDYKQSDLKKFRDKNKRVEIYLSLKEYEEFLKITSDLGYGNKVGKTVKQFSLAYKNNSFIYPDELKNKLNKMYLAIKKSADNINQMAHFYNLKGYVLDEKKLFEHHREMEDSIKMFVDKNLNNDNKISSKKDQNI